MTFTLIITSFLAYLLILFALAYWADSREQSGHSLVNNPYVYALSMGVYCTAWTFYGSVGRAATQGLNFLPIFLGPSILAPLWILVLRKIIMISKAQRISSVADFLSSRYGKSARLGGMAALIAVFGIIPYISIQLKAIAVSFGVLLGRPPGSMPDNLFQDAGFYVTAALALFSILFGARKLDPNEQHQGLIAAIAFESLFKLVAFLAVGLFVTFGLFNGFGDLFGKAYEAPELRSLFSLQDSALDKGEWFWLLILSMFAVMLLPRQFHVAVVENNNPKHLYKASWLFPLYLLLINIFVLPIALGGQLLLGGSGSEPDTYVLSLPLAEGMDWLALLAALGGFSAASSMVIIAVTALSIMISNNLVLPILLKPGLFDARQGGELTKSLLGIRRVGIFIILLLAYVFFRAVGFTYTLVSIGLMSFVGIAQLGPAFFGGLYWKGATRVGAQWGLLVGFLVWAYTLPFPTLIEAGFFSEDILLKGPWGIKYLKPYSLFGLEGFDHISHSAFWTLLLNSGAFFLGSLYLKPGQLEISQADLFVDFHKYSGNEEAFEVLHRRARVGDIQLLLDRFLGSVRRKEVFRFYEQRTGATLQIEQTGNPELVNLAETQLAGAIGSASARLIISTIAKEEPISLEEMFKILEQTQEVIQYSKALETKSQQLQETTRQLRKANEQLQELDRLKADFITTVTHELRTPITSIKALSKILLDHNDLSGQQSKEFLSILVKESERIARLINQVLEVEKIQTHLPAEQVMLDFNQVVANTFAGLEQLMLEKSIQGNLKLPSSPSPLHGDADRLTQVVVNLLANAIKFCPDRNGQIVLQLEQKETALQLTVKDNGRGIPAEKQKLIFEKFTQVSDGPSGKPKGSGLGLFITKTIVEQHRGRIQVYSQEGQGATFEVEFPRLLLPVDALL